MKVFVTLVERHSRYLMLAKIPNRETQTVVTALIRQARHRDLPLVPCRISRQAVFN